MFYQNTDTKYFVTDVFHVIRKSSAAVADKRSFAALSLRLSGSAEFSFSNKKVSAVKGSVTYIPAGVSYRISGSDQELIILHLKTENDASREIETVDVSGDTAITEIFSKILSENSNRAPGFSHRINALFYSLLSQLCVKYEKRAILAEDRRIAPALQLIRDAYHDPSISVHDLAKSCSVSEVYLRKLFRKVHGMSPISYLNAYRINQACLLLRSGFYKVGDVAEKTGFSDIKYFSTAFKAHMGESPRSYMRHYFYGTE